MEELKTQSSASDRHPAVTKGQEDLAGVKSVEIHRNFKKNSDDEYVVTQSTRTEMVYESAEKARDAYMNIYNAKEQAEFEDTEEHMDKIDAPEKEVAKPEITSMTEDEEKSAFDARRKAALTDSLTVQADMPENFKADIVGNKPWFNQLGSNPMEALHEAIKQLEGVIYDISRGIEEGKDPTEDDTLDTQISLADTLVMNCNYILANFFKNNPRYQGEANKLYDYVQKLQDRLDLYRTGTIDAEDAAIAYARNEDYNARQMELPFDQNIETASKWDTELLVQAYVPGATGVSDTPNPGSVSFGYGAKNQQGLENYTKFNGNVSPEHQYQTNKPFAYDQTEQEVTASNEQPNALLQRDFPVSQTEHELKMGVNRELEHTDQPAAATEIALDHLAEDPAYYTKLNQVMPESGPEEKKERVIYVKPHDKEVEEFDYEKVGKETMFPGVK